MHCLGRLLLLELECLDGIVNEGSKALERPLDLVDESLEEGHLGSLESLHFELILFEQVADPRLGRLLRTLVHLFFSLAFEIYTLGLSILHDGIKLFRIASK